jgi:hypothetical protein
MIQRVNLYVSREEAMSAAKNKTMFSVVDFPNGWKAEVDGVRLTIATPEDVVLSKLEWAKMTESERHLSDVAGIVRMQRNLDLSHIEAWVLSLGLGAQWDAARAKTVSSATTEVE